MEILIYVSLYCYLICAVQSLFSYGLNILNEIKETRNYLNGHEYFSENDRLKMKNEVKEMFYFGYDNYMKYAFPLDELNPIYCSGRGPDKERPDNININDVLGGYSLTLIDSLDTLAVFGNNTEFYKAAKLIIQNVSFDQDSTVQVFEATIRVIGGLLAGHLLITDPEQEFGILFPEDEYDGELLNLAHDLANRLLPAFDNSSTGLPWPRVNLRDGVPIDCSTTTCTAGIGTLIVEFGILSFLLQDYTFENVARRAVKSLWKFRSKSTGLFGNVIDITTGEWIGTMSGLGAGIDSFYEYLLKGFILFGESEDLHRFNDLYASVMEHMRKGRVQCNNGSGEPTLFVNVDMNSGKTVNTWIDSLQASFTGVQVLRGDLDEAVCSHALYYKLWQRYGALPERFNWNLKMPDVWFYPLRPEFVESTYLLYQATKHPFYLHVGKEIIKNLNNHTKVKCGFATIHNVLDKTLEDRMESFFLSETLKYLYLLFDFENPLNRDASNWIFSTEGHVFKLNDKYREKAWRDEIHLMQRKDNERFTFISNRNSSLNWKCDSSAKFKFSKLPLKEEYFRQIDKFIQGSN